MYSVRAINVTSQNQSSRRIGRTSIASSVLLQRNRNKRTMASLFLSLAVGALVLLVFYLASVYTYWKKRRVQTAKGVIPLLGHMAPMLTGKVCLTEFVQRIYNENKDSSMVGFYRLTSPVLLVREPQLVKTVLQSNFSSFHENGASVEPEVDPLLAKNPFFTYGEVWSTGRKRLTYAFSSMRLKILFEAVKGVCKKFDDYLERRLKESDGKYETELKKLFSKFTGEVVANSGLGIEGGCFDEVRSPTAFDEIGKVVFEQELLKGIMQSIMFFMPSINKVLKMRFLPKQIDQHFRQIVRKNLEIRQNDPTPRNDFLQLMIQLEKTEGEKLNEEILVSHSLSFFIDGYETSSITLSFIGYQLAVHQDIQQKLRDEILSVNAKYDGQLTFEGLKEMTYMDQVINESQRCYTALGQMVKVCTEEFELHGSDGTSCSVKPGTNIVIPVHALHRDPKFWSDPDVFDPERFNEDRKQSIEKMTFIPFGEGPRICVGMRMALLQIKAALAALFMKYKLELSPKTQQPLKMVPFAIMASPIGGLWVNITRL